MSTHPNALLLLKLTPDDLARKTYRAICEAENASDMDPTIKIGGARFRIKVMESDYDEGYQIAAKEGQIVLFNFLTYGYGEEAAWDEVKARVEALDAWAKEACDKYKCSYAIKLSANYW